ncbi:MAG: apolipoprotein N-acyltransferase [Spirochaetota bacterium]
MKINKFLLQVSGHYYVFTVLLFYVSFLTPLNLLVPLLSVFAWVSLVPLFLYIYNKPLKQVYITSFITGLFGFGVVYYWMGDFGQALWYGKAVIIALIIPCISVFFATKILLAEYLSRMFPRLTMVIYPSVWIAFDWVQTIGTMAFPWNFLGYTQYPFVNFIQVASITGIFGVTFIIVFANISIAELIKARLVNSNYRPALFACSIVCIMVVVSTVYGFIRLKHYHEYTNSHLRVAMVQSCFSPWENWTKNKYFYLDILKNLTRQAMQHEPDIIVWSESATLENISYSYFNGNLNHFEEEVLALAAGNRVPLLTGEIGIIEDVVNRRYYPQNSIVLINSAGQVVDTYAKIHLVPFGEWFPYGELFPFVNDIIDAFGGSNFMPGDSPRIFVIGSFRCAPLICYENIFHRLCRHYANAGIDFYVNITNLLWTENPVGPMQHFYFSVFRAIENGIWFVSAGNSGFTALIDPYGRITTSVPLMQKTYCVGDMDLSMNTGTVYRLCGDVILYIAWVFIFVLCAIVTGNKLVVNKRER